MGTRTTSKKTRRKAPRKTRERTVPAPQGVPEQHAPLAAAPPETASASISAPTRSSKTYSGATGEVVAALVDDGDKEGVLRVFRRLELEIEKLQRDLAKLKSAKDRHSEGVTREQLALLFEELASLRSASASADDSSASTTEEVDRDEVAHEVGALDDELKRRAEKPRTPPKGPKRRPLPESLSRVDNVLPIPEEAHLCPTCREPMAALAPEVHEVLDYRPGELFVRRDIREVRACRHADCGVVRADLGDKVIPGGAYGSTLVAELVVRKFREGLTLHRVAQWTERLGFPIPSSSMSDQILWAADLMTPVWRALLRGATHAEVMQLDGTGISVVQHDDRGKRMGMRMGTLWCVVGDRQSVAYTYASTGHKDGQRAYDLGPAEVLALRPSGFVVADADSKFDAAFLSRLELVECGCSMHARRYFVRALDAGDKRAAIVLQLFKKLALLEQKYHRDGLDGDDLVDARRRRSKPVWEGMLAWCEGEIREGPPRALLTIASRYVKRHFAALTRHLDDARLPPDNGLVERLFRRIAIVRKNALFVGSHDGGRRAAVLFSIFATCELLGVNPTLYLADVLPRLARGVCVQTDIPELLPAAWIARHPEARVEPLNVRQPTDVADF